MRKLGLVFTVALFTLLPSGTAQAQDTFEVFGGYSYLRPPVTLSETQSIPPPVCPIGIVPPCPPIQTTFATTVHPNLNGWEASGVYNAYHWLGVAADFSGHYGSANGVSTHFNTYLFGPQLQLHSSVSPFVHVLFGAAHETTGQLIAPELLISPTSSTAFATAIGGGIDVKVARFVSFRPIQLDYLITRFGSSTQNQPRASAGLVVHF
jgi:hypothetical protein